jgi:UPF0716 protein FxsA
MKFLLFLIFVVVPLAEVAILIQVGQIIGVVPTIALVVLTAVIGVALLKRQGLAALARAQRSMDAGELPIDSVIDGVCLLVAGAFLLTPGLITDTAGFLLLVPPFRHGLARWAFAKLQQSGNVRVWTAGGPAGSPGGGSGRDPRGRQRGPEGEPVIEGEYEEVEPNSEEPARDRSSPPVSDQDGSPWRKH